MKIYNLEFKDKTLQTWMLLRQTHILCEQYAEQMLLDTGLTAETITVLAILDKSDEPVIPAELARYTSRANQTLAGLINRMTASGLVERDKKRKGQPYTTVKLTPKGKQLAKVGAKAYEKVIAKLFTIPVGLGQEPLLTADDHKAVRETLEIIRNACAEQLRIKVIDKKCKN